MLINYVTFFNHPWKFLISYSKAAGSLILNCYNCCICCICYSENPPANMSSSIPPIPIPIPIPIPPPPTYLVIFVNNGAIT